MEFIVYILVLACVFVVGCFCGFMFHSLMNVSAMKQGKAFFKYKNRWHPYNPFRGGK
jgi:hypothetical protein